MPPPGAGLAPPPLPPRIASCMAFCISARITAVGAVAIVVASAPFARDNRRRGAIFVVLALSSFLLQQILVARALTHRDEGEPDDLDAVDALTLSRGLAAGIVAASAYSDAIATKPGGGAGSSMRVVTIPAAAIAFK